MAGKTVVFNPGKTNALEYFTVDIKEPDDPTIPNVDFQVLMRFENFIFDNSENIPPGPILAHNPVIDNIAIHRQGLFSAGTWLLDTGAMVSLISTAQAAALGLTDDEGEPLIEPDFEVPIGGIGGMIMMPGFKIDRLVVPTLCGYKLIFNNPRIAVHDIGILDESTGQYHILDGVFGSNFLCATMNMDTWDLAQTPFEHVVFDTQNALLGFDVNDVYPLPDCNQLPLPWPRRDFNRDARINLKDLRILTDEWLNNCDWLNWNCRGADLNSDTVVNFTDLAEFLYGLKED